MAGPIAGVTELRQKSERCRERRTHEELLAVYGTFAHVNGVIGMTTISDGHETNSRSIRAMTSDFARCIDLDFSKIENDKLHEESRFRLCDAADGTRCWRSVLEQSSV